MFDRSILDWIIGYRKLKVLAAACKLRVFTVLAERPQSADELAASCGAELLPLRAVLDTCVAIGLLDLQDGKYSNRDETAAFLVESESRYLGNLIQLFSSEAPQWEGLDELLASGRAPELKPVSSVNPRHFTLAMHSFGIMGEADALVEAVALDDARNLVDVGCGSGIYSITLCKHYPLLHATLIDREETLEVTREIIEKNNVEDRITLQPGDFTHDSYGEDRDVVLLSDVIYGPPKICTYMFNAAYKALKTGGVLIIRGYFSDPEDSRPLFGALFNVSRLLWDPENIPLTVDQLRLWLEETGFCAIETSALSDLSSLLIAKK